MQWDSRRKKQERSEWVEKSERKEGGDSSGGRSWD